MSRRMVAGGTVLMVVALSGALVSTQAPPAGRPAAGRSDGRTYTVPRTPWGHPDLQGVWTSDDARGTPLQRPAEFGERQFLTDEEFAARKQRDDETRADTRAGAGTFVGEVGTRSLRQTSLVVDPPNGRIPPLTPEAQKRAASTPRPNPLLPESYTDRSLFERCITRGPLPAFPTLYGNGLQIVQAPDTVAISYEMIHEARVVPLSPRSHVGEQIRAYTGDPRGRWEGDTLVVETTNFTDRTNAGTARHTEALRVIERFTRISDETIQYEVTVSDPNTWVAPWRAQLPLSTQPGYQVYPYECHEGNHALANMLSAARAEEKMIEEYVKKGLPPPPLARPGDNQILPPDPSFGRRR